MVYIATQVPNYGFYPECAQYINVDYAANRTSATERGVTIPNHSLRYPLTGGSYIASYDAWCSALSAAGTNFLRMSWGGWNVNWSSPPIYSIEPPPYGKYHVWNVALDDSNLTTFRSAQVSGVPGSANFPTATWNASNIKELFDACETYGIEVCVEMSEYAEFNSGWYNHAWNYNNYYLNGVRCESQDRGFLSERYQLYTDPDALTAMKNRISFIIGMIGSYKCVCMWGICSEGNWSFTPGFWGETAWSSTMTNNMRNYVVPYYSEVAKHIRATDPYNRPIMAGVAQSPADYVWPSNPDDLRNVKMEPLMVYPIDIVGTNCYQSTYKSKALHLNSIREKVHPKQILIHQYYPEGWELGSDAPLRIEDDPYTLSKRCEWLGMALKWSTGPGRWGGLEESAHNVWIRGGYADPDWYSIGAVTSTFRGFINWKDWSGAQDWSDYVSSTGLDYSLTTGDGNHFVGVLVWTSGGSKTLTISNVTDGAWTFKVFDWTDGGVDATATPTASSNSLSFALTPGQSYQTFVYGEKD